MLTINSSDLESILEHSKEDFPREACGIMKGNMYITEEEKVSEIVTVYRVRNIRENPFIGYKMHALDLYRAFVEVDKELELVGFYHSHPNGPQGPSKTDIEECNYHGYSFLIISLGDYKNPDVSAWILYDNRAEEEKLVIIN